MPPHSSPQAPLFPDTPPLRRRQLLQRLAALPALGLAGIPAGCGRRAETVDAVSGATVRVEEVHIKDLKGQVPKGKIGDHEISRLIIGGNLIGGWAHARDLLYVSQLFLAYNTPKKICETLMLAEKCGVNAMNITGSQLKNVNQYRKMYGSTLKVICQVHPTRDDPNGAIDFAIDHGADLLQIQGNCCDWRVRDGEIDVLATALDRIRSQGYTAGLGAHSVQALQACDKAGIKPDFYMKTLHHDQYWSAHPKEKRVPFSVDGGGSQDHNEFHDNMFCLFADETIEFMRDKKEPFIGFKVLAGGAIHPNSGFRFAFEGGADFICVGMFDFQVVADANITLDILADLPNRTRPWCG